MADAAFLDAYFAISAVKAKFCRTLDTKDWAGFAECLTEDYELDTSPSGGALTRGRDAVLDMLRASLTGAATAHHVHSPEMSVNGDTADVVWAMQDRVVFAPEQAKQFGFAGLTGFGHYHERYVRKNGTWRLSRQKATRLHVDMQKLP
jgi:hypothetical protein